MTSALELATFAQDLEYDDLSPDIRDALKQRVLDGLAVAIPATVAEPPRSVYRTVRELESDGPCTLWGRESGSSPVGAALHNTALVRYLDHMDSFLAPNETPHPSDTLAPVVAAAEYADGSGTDLLTALAVAYEIQGELAWNAPLREKGFDYVTHTVLAGTAGAASALGLDLEETRNAIAIAGTGHNALRVTRTGDLTDWKAIASANAARNAVYAAMLAKNGVEGPRELFDGQKGWKDVISGPFELELTPGERVHDVMTKRYVGETHAQSAVEGIIELADAESLEPSTVTQIRLETFSVAKLIIGGGEGSRYEVESRSQADSSLPYMLAAALIDRKLGFDQYEPERIQRADVQTLLQSVAVTEDPELTDRFEAGEMPAIIDVTTEDGTTYRIEKNAFRGHPRDPMQWADLERKFETIAGDHLSETARTDLLETVRSLEEYDVADLCSVVA